MHYKAGAKAANRTAGKLIEIISCSPFRWDL